MNIAFFSDPLESSIAQEIKLWSSDILEKPNAYFNGFPHEYLDGLNNCISEGMFIDKDIWLMGFHPDDEPSEFVQEVEFAPLVETPYAMIFVQRLSKLQQAADKLDKKGYYNSYDAEYNAREIYETRENLYRKLKNGDET